MLNVHDEGVDENEDGANTLCWWLALSQGRRRPGFRVMISINTTARRPNLACFYALTSASAAVALFQDELDGRQSAANEACEQGRPSETESVLREDPDSPSEWSPVDSCPFQTQLCATRRNQSDSRSAHRQFDSA